MPDSSRARHYRDTVTPEAAGAGADALALGLEEAAEGIFKAMAPGIEVTEAMKEAGATALCSSRGLDADDHAVYVFKVMMDEAGRP